ncbi:MAG TPA: type II toxin-antitoxin system Phd/YefM family antitoxin [Rhizobiaceae bacterium]|nr:type II toxin-antitoxin system Phd/YefM family antitoxin [Rhizobiaceae bacterium]
MKTFAFSDLNRQSGEVLDAALAAPVTLTKHGKPKVVVMSIAEFERLTYPRAYSIHDMPDDVRDELLAGLNELVKNG